jgi:hypothetical protein
MIGFRIAGLLSVSSRNSACGSLSTRESRSAVTVAVRLQESEFADWRSAADLRDVASIDFDGKAA